MGTVKQSLLGTFFSIATLFSAAAPAADDDATRAGRWEALQKALFPGRSLHDGAGIVNARAVSPVRMAGGFMSENPDTPGARARRSSAARDDASSPGAQCDDLSRTCGPSPG